MTYLALAFSAEKANDRRGGIPYVAVVSVAKHGAIAAATKSAIAQRPWHFLYFFPDEHGHGSFRPVSNDLYCSRSAFRSANIPSPII